MIQYVLRRIVLSVPVLFFVATITFSLGFYGPGDPLASFMGYDLRGDPAIIARIRLRLGLDRPFHVQFSEYLGGLVRGDMGTSINQFGGTGGLPVFKLIRRTLPVSLQLGLGAGVVMAVVGIPLGALAAVKQNTWIDYWIVGGSIAVRSIPPFVLAPLVMIIVVLYLDLMKTPVGWDGLFSQKAILPVLLIAAGPLLVVVRQSRAGVLEVMGQDYLRTARSKGLTERMVVTRHVMKNAITPVVTSIGLILGGLLTGAFFIELIFSIPGYAQLTINALQLRDYPVILGTTLFGAFIIIVANLIVDISYGLLDPRVRFE